MTDALQTILSETYWSTRASTAAMTRSAMEFLGEPYECGNWQAVERIIAAWCRNRFGMNFAAMAREIESYLESKEAA